MFGFLKKKKPVKKNRKRNRSKNSNEIKQILEKVSTKEDVERIIQEVSSSREAILTEVTKMPASISSAMVDQITLPLKEYITAEIAQSGMKQLSIDQAVKQLDTKQLSSSQAIKQQGLADAIAEMKISLERLTQRHLKVLNILVQNREEWLDYEELGKFCNPQLTGSCIRGYIADLINSYKIPIEKRNFGRRSKIKISPSGVKQLAISKLSD